MKNIIKKISLLSIIISGLAFNAVAQVQYKGCNITGTYSSAIGKNNTASGNNSFAGGYNSKAAGSNSFAFGYNSRATQSTNAALGNTAIATGTGSIAIGNYVKATAQNAFVFGSGTTSSYPLTNSTANSIAFGVNSNQPTMLITKSLNNNYTGKVAIGQITTPQAKLHIKSDSNEDASVMLEPSNKNSYKAFIKLYDEDHTITVDNTAAMELNAGNGTLLFRGESYCFGNNAFYISPSGMVGINTDKLANGFALCVDGGLISTKVHIKEVKQWPDHVFSEGYQLLGLDELQQYLEYNKHLPGVPSEKEVMENGYDVNEMQYVMLEKIEELTRYILSLHDEIDHLKRQQPKNDSIRFSYDANGNRISRSLIIQKANNPREVQNNVTNDNYSLFPNPTSDQFSLVLKEQPKEASIRAILLNATGVILEETEIHGNSTTFDLSGKPCGIYFFELEVPEGHLTWKVIKQ